MDRITVPGTDPPQYIRRRRSYGLDVAFGVLGNSSIVPELVENILNPQGVPFRDGFPYQHNLAAVRGTVDELPPDAWNDSLYMLWLPALRTLSEPTSAPEYPQAMRTRAWAMKTLNTQLASWTQLRHDTVLYAKETVVGPFLCSYPAGFVEPRPEFYLRMAGMADRASDLFGNLNLSLAEPIQMQPYGSPAEMGRILRAFFTRFGDTCRALEAMAGQELQQEPFTVEQREFVRNWVEAYQDYVGGRLYKGHYTLLFLRANEGKDPEMEPPEGSTVIPPPHESNQPDELVTTVLTAGFSDPDLDPGAVLHEGVGQVNLLMMVVDNGPDLMVHTGPVLSHYEFEMPLATRLTDEDWKARVRAGATPPPPPWTQAFLVQRPAADP